MPSTHIAKRPYAGSHSQSQSTITSYFNPSPGSSSISSCSVHPELTSSTLTPSLPHTVQSNLLSVGMRVRKSVPEGYKTGSYSAFTLFSDTSSPSSQDPQQRAPRRGRTAAYKRKELTPFCGILKVGGLGSQGGFDRDDVFEEDTLADEEDEVPWLSSQGSTISTVSVPEFHGSKRRFDEDELQAPQFGSIAFLEEEISPRAKPSRLGPRAMAVPRRRIGKAKTTAGKGGVVVGQENTGMGTGPGVDFEDAEFLDYGLWEGTQEVDEVVMSDA